MVRAGYMGPQSATHKIAQEAIITLGAARAVLMQIAHPLVASGVSQHSHYLCDPWGRAQSTLYSSQALTFGSKTQALEAAKTINRIHRDIHGTISTGNTVYPPNTPYTARDPELLLWVHATLIDTVLFTYTLFVGHLTRSEQDQYYQESKNIAHLLGLTQHVLPPSLEDLQCYIHDMLYSNRLSATPEARELARGVLFPYTTVALKPFFHLHYQITCALLPPPVRAIYDLHWSTRRQKVFDMGASTLRTIIPCLPRTLRLLPITRRIIDTTQCAHNA